MQEHRQTARIAVIMGVSGSGKTTIGRALARRLGWLFQEGDALHPPENVAKMKAGYPLDDEDRAPWLTAIAAKIDAWRARGDAGVVTCSALKWLLMAFRYLINDSYALSSMWNTVPPRLTVTVLFIC